MADVYEMPYKGEETKQAKSRNNAFVESGYVRVHVVTLIIFVLLSILAMTSTGILVYFTTAGDRDCKLVLPEGIAIVDTEATKQDSTKVPTTTTTTTAATTSDQGPGVVYTRWGRTACPNNTKTLYDGYAAGSHYTHSGGMVDTLCLPKQPQFSKHLAGVQSHSPIYGTEYDSGNIYFEAIFDKPVQDHDVPCVVCEATGRLIQVMLPARTKCFDGWKFEYTGYMMAEFRSHHRTQVKCVDKNPEVLESQIANDNGNVFFFIEPAGQLPDPPYSKEKELTCVICTK